MNDAQAACVAGLVSRYLDAYPDRQSPFRKDFLSDIDSGRPNERMAFQAFQSMVLNALSHLEDHLFGTEPDERETYAFLCLVYPGAPRVIPPLIFLEELLQVLRCAFPDVATRTPMIRSFVIAYGCGNWRNTPLPWPDAMAAVKRMARSAARGAERWIRNHVFGAAQYADNQSVRAAATAANVQPLEIKNTLAFAEAMLGRRLPVEIGQNGITVEWGGRQVLIPALRTVLKPGAKRVLWCLTAVRINGGGKLIEARAGARLVIAAREKGFDIEVLQPSGEPKTIRQCAETVTIEGPAALEISSCNCAKGSCVHRHAFAAWSPRHFERLSFDPGTDKVASFDWNGAELMISGVVRLNGPTKFAIRNDVVSQIAFSGVVNGKPKLITGQHHALHKDGRLRLQNDNGTLHLSSRGRCETIAPGERFAIVFGRDPQANPNIALWNCNCTHHIDDPWIVPPISEEERPVELVSFVATALTGPNYPIQDKSLSEGMYFAVATDLGFDLDGRIHSASIVRNRCSVCGVFEGPACGCGRPFQPGTDERSKVEGRIILIETTMEMKPPQYVVQTPPPYPFCDEFLRCKQCENYYQITSLTGRGMPFCIHVIGRKPFVDRLAEAAWNGDLLIAARVWEQMRRETNQCDQCPPSRPPIAPTPWCPLNHAIPVVEPVLAERTTTLWVRR